MRYADDFKLFTKSYQQARKLFYAVQDWLKGRLGLFLSRIPSVHICLSSFPWLTLSKNPLMKNYQQAKKLFYAVQDWLKGRLGLDISPEKSKIVNLRKQYSEFLGLRIKAANHGSMSP